MYESRGILLSLTHPRTVDGETPKYSANVDESTYLFVID